jgi:ubiquinol-cytochrome c reductase cytochrome b subunit
MFSALLILLSMPFVDFSRLRGAQFKPLTKILFFIFAANFLVLMALGAKHVESPFIELGQISTALYFGFFIVLLPIVGTIENTIIFFSSSNKTNKSYIFPSILAVIFLIIILLFI